MRSLLPKKASACSKSWTTNRGAMLRKVGWRLCDDDMCLLLLVCAIKIHTPLLFIRLLCGRETTLGSISSFARLQGSSRASRGSAAGGVCPLRAVVFPHAGAFSPQGGTAFGCDGHPRAAPSSRLEKNTC